MGMQGNGGNETIFTMEATPLKYGPGAAEEVGWEVRRLGVGRIMLVSDPGVVAAGITQRIQELIEGEGDRKSTRLNSSHANISYAVFCLKKKTKLHGLYVYPYQHF